MFKFLYPDEYIDSTYNIDFKKLYNSGYRGLIFDIDNTLVPHGAPATKQAVELFKKLRELGFKTCLISNNKEKRVKPFANKVDSVYLDDAHKPSKEAYIKCIYDMNTNINNTVFIGDQLFTDILGAKRVGIHAILVKYIHPKEEIQIVLKRILEKPILYFYKKNKGTAK